MPSTVARFTVLSLACLCLVAWSGTADSSESVAVTAPACFSRPIGVASDYLNIDEPIAGVAATADVVFVGAPLDGAVLVFSTHTGQQIGTVPPPPEGFAVPFIMHIVGDGKVTILGAGGLPQPKPFVPANPILYEYEFSFSPARGFSATLVREASFASVLVGFAEDFVHLDDGRYLVSDSILGSIWVLEPDGTVSPGIVPKSFAPSDALPLLAICPTMPEVTVNGYPFLFSGSTNPGVEPLAVRNGQVYYFSPCARGIYTFPLDVLTDNRQPYERASSISLVAPTPPDVQVEELLDFTFNPYDPLDMHLYAAHALALDVIRVDVRTGEREVLASGPALFDFPSALSFLPPELGTPQIVVASNQQERSPITNDAVTENTFTLPFIVARVSIPRNQSQH
jgi:hypothetical protein